MKVRILVAAVMCGCLVATSAAFGQQPAQTQAAGAASRPFIFVDLGFILQNHPTMKKEIEAIQTNMKKVDEEFAAKRDRIMADMKALGENYTEGSPEYQRKEKSIADADTQFRLEIVRQRKVFDEARAEVLARVHAQLTGLLKHACEYYGAAAVLRCSREKVDPKKPNTIELAMSQEVFYFNPNYDLTDWVLSSIQPQQPQQTQATQAAAANSATRPGTQVLK